MASLATKPASLESSHNSDEGKTDLSKTPRPELSQKPDAIPSPITSPKEVAATKPYASIDEILIDSRKYQSDLESLRARPLWPDLLIGIVGAGVAFLCLWFYSYSNPKAGSLQVEVIAP